MSDVSEEQRSLVDEEIVKATDMAVEILNDSVKFQALTQKIGELLGDPKKMVGLQISLCVIQKVDDGHPEQDDFGVCSNLIN